MDVYLNACKTYAKRGSQPVVQEGGVYLGLFGVRPAGEGGLDVLVYNFARHQIPAYRLPDISMPLNTRSLAWLKSCHNVTLAQLLARCNEALNDDASSRLTAESAEQEIFYDFLAALCVSLESLIAAMRVWPTLPDQARLSPDVIELPTSDSDNKRPAQMLLLSVILPAPDHGLALVQTRASGIQVPQLDSTRRDWDKPPAPFVYSPWNLWSRAQTMILRGAVYRDIAQQFSNEVGKMYAPPVNDIAAEIAADKKPKGVNPFHGDEKVGSVVDLASVSYTPSRKRRPGTAIKGASDAIQKAAGMSADELDMEGEYAGVRDRADM
jgi:hypothetical protein